MRTLLFLLLAAISLQAQPERDARDVERAEKVDALFAAWNRTDAPGYSVAVIRDGKTVFAKGYGMADLERDVRITPRTVFDIGSTSKQFTAAAVLLLEQEGKLSLDDDIRKYLPELRAYERPVTIRHLIHHTSGMRDYLALMGFAGLSFSNDYSDHETLSWIARQKALNFAPGEEHLYSNSGYYVLGQLVARVSGMSLRKYAAQKIFEPLGMTNTHFHDDPTEVVRHRAIGYAPAGSGYTIEMSNYHVVGDGGLYTTTEDLAKWDANFYDPVVGGATFLESLHRRGKLASGEELNYASALVHGTHSGHRTVSHGGSWAGYRADMLRFPEKKLTVIALSNVASADPSTLARSVADIYLDTPTPVAAPPSQKTSSGKPKAWTAAQLQAFASLYVDPKTGTYRTVEMRDGKLWYLRGTRPVELRPLADGTFELTGSPLILRFSNDTVEALLPGQPKTVFSRVVAVTPTPAELAVYAGEYRSDEIAAPHHLSVREGALTARIGFSAETLVFRPRERDVFESNDGVRLRFHRDAQGAINAYTIGAGRVKNIRFERAP
ncbi:MAG TPA: serine hydrolase domain-containing protein [Thermoanaerobaculia bacterium]|nr:serine hydrolase domain-containing protein [Thermoanaerobaculia bacterium]